MLMMATARRNEAETIVPSVSPIRWKASNRRWNCQNVYAQHRRCQDDHRRMTERKEQPHACWSLSLLHQLTRHVVDCGDVVGVNRVPQAEAIGEKRGSQQYGLMVQGRNGPRPGQQIAAPPTR